MKPNVSQVGQVTEDLQDLNLRFLLLVRELAKAKDPSATLVTGLDKDAVETIGNLSLTEIEHLSTAPVMYFNLRFQADQISMLANNRRVPAMALNIASSTASK